MQYDLIVSAIVRTIAARHPKKKASGSDTCSGDIHCGDPMIMLGAILSDLIFTATPKSQIFTVLLEDRRRLRELIHTPICQSYSVFVHTFPVTQAGNTFRHKKVRC